MSQNFELLNQLEADFRFAGAVPKEAPSLARPAERANGHTSSHELLTLAQTVFLSGDPTVPHVVVLCGIDRDSASSEICVNLGRILAAFSTRPTCLVDAHQRSPGLEKMLRTDRPISFPDRSQDHCREVTPNLWLADIAWTGSRQDAGFAPASELKQRIADLRAKFDFVLIDAPGVNTRGEAGVFGQLADGAILVIEANLTRKAAALKARQALEGMNVRILGSVLNNRTFPIPERLYQKL